MKRISVSEYQFQTTTEENRLRIKAMAREFADDSGIDWQYEYRWMTMTDEAFLLARLKYWPLLSAMTVRTC